MTKYWREGFWRSSIYGNVHWVEGHEVDRAEWSQATPVHRNEEALREARAQAGGIARLVQPNADCPVCGRPVFFYQNQFGSRVFFDELGPPWPKHPCTVQPPEQKSGATLITLTSERLRTQEEFDQIGKWSVEDLDLAFARRYGRPPWNIASYVGLYESHGAGILVIRTDTGYRYFAPGPSQRLSIADGQLITYSGNMLSYISPVDLSVTEIRLRPIGARRALHHVLDLEPLDARDEDAI